MHDFAQDVSYCLLDLLVDALLYVLLGVINLSHLFVTALIENHAISFLVQVKHVIRADSLALAWLNWMHPFFRGVFSVSAALVHEARGLTDALLLAVELGTDEVALNLEYLVLVLAASGC